MDSREAMTGSLRLPLRSLLPLVVILVLAGCRAFVPPPPEMPPRAKEGETVLGTAYLREDQTVEVEGRFVGGELLASRMEIEEPDDEVGIKGTLTAWDPPRGGAVSGIRFRITGKSRFEDEEGRELDPGSVKTGDWVGVDTRPENGRLLLRKLELRTREDGDQEELQGPIDDVDYDLGELEIAGIRVRWTPRVLIIWDVEGEDPPPPDERGIGGAARLDTRLRRKVVKDDEEVRPFEQLRLGELMTVGGEVQYEVEWRDNHDLRDSRNADRLVHEPSLKLELTMDISPQVFGFFQLQGKQDIIHFDQEKDRESDHRGRLNEGFFLFEDIPMPGLALQLGRQDFDHGREWVYDDELDAARLYANLHPALLELSVSTVLSDTDPEEDGITNYIAALEVEPIEEQELLAYFVHRKGGTRVDLSRNHVGLSGEGDIEDFSWWLDVGVSFGREDGRSFAGWGADAAVMYELEDLPWEPYIYSGFAWGSGDDDPFDGSDGNFRQTGLNDNNDRFGGVTSFRYLGELVRPELSNLMVFTAGFGFRPLPETSLDFLYHHYRQVEAAPFMRDTRLRLDPSGASKDMGNELDFVLGLESFYPVEVELVFAYFHPGAAFRSEDDAWFATMQVEFNF